MGWHKRDVYPMLIGEIIDIMEIRFVNDQMLHIDEDSLVGTNLANAKLHRAILENQDMRGRNLENADLRGAILTQGNLTNAKLVNCSLITAFVDNAILIGANLSCANAS